MISYYFLNCDNLNAIKETNNIYVFKTVDYLNILLKLLAMQIRNIIIYYNYMEMKMFINTYII